MSVLVDANVFVAAADSRERRSPQAKAFLRRLASEGPITTDHVLLEVWAILRRRHGYAVAERFLHGVRGTPITVEQVTRADMERALAIGESWADQGFDLVDRTSFAVMERLGCRRAATFDSDFAIYRFGPDRREAFTVVTP